MKANQRGRWRLWSGVAAIFLSCPDSATSATEAPYNAAGERVGEVTATSAIVHTRLTAAPTRNNRGYSVPIASHTLIRDDLLKVKLPEGLSVPDLEGACPGKTGRVRLLYGTDARLSDAAITEWAEARAESDFTHQFNLRGLAPDTSYYYAVEMVPISGAGSRRGEISRFRTAPAPDRRRPVKFHVITGQDYGCRDRLDGYRAYDAMLRLGGDFLVSTGDNVYYDIDLPIARSVEIARFHWHRMYSQPTIVRLFQNMSGYWMKDDHDTFEDDCWPTRLTDRVQPMTYQTLAPVFSEQTPSCPRPYRHVRWGKGLEVWFPEVRDFRSPNSDPDGPNKTLWGREQKDWLKRTLLESEADFRLLVSPTCLVGPGGDAGRAIFQMPGGGADSHGDGGYAFEGREFRHWARENKLKNLLIINGDRHWQYHSVDPETGIHEFSCGPLTDRHAFQVDRDPKHRFLRCKGGFLSAMLQPGERNSRLLIRFHDVNGEIVYEQSF